MAAVGGSIITVGINGRPFAVAADADATTKLGGRENEVQQNGNSTARIIKTANGWAISGLKVSVDDSTDDLEYLQAISDSAEVVPIYVTYASNVTLSGTGTITGEVAGSSGSSTAEIALGGGGKLERQ